MIAAAHDPIVCDRRQSRHFAAIKPLDGRKETQKRFVSAVGWRLHCFLSRAARMRVVGLLRERFAAFFRASLAPPGIVDAEADRLARKSCDVAKRGERIFVGSG